jgi:hypothetical protein
MKGSHLVSLVIPALLFSACGSPTTPTFNTINVNSTADFLLVGNSETFTAMVNKSDGTTASLGTGAIWGTDAAIVATVGSSTGTVSPLSAGMVTVYVDYQSVRGKKLMRVIPQFQGSWSGAWVKQGCSESGGFVGSGFCDGLSSGGLTMAFTQNRDQISGAVVIGSVPVSASGSIAVDGTLTLAGTTTTTTTSGTFTTAITSWNTLAANGGQTGSFVFTVTLAGTVGQAIMTAGLSNVLKTANAVPPVAFPNRSLAERLGAR